MRNRAFAWRALIVVLAFGLMSFAIRFTTLFESWFWLPTWPNMGDAVFIFIAGLVLLVTGFRNRASP